ncbi:hypothetical protein BC629DRAFT_1588383 [Irpex lacteus]|nr:hypothetical protein BC629DRAFT_1588383 [Irpex lacteus]
MSTPDVTAGFEFSFHLLSIAAVIFCSLSALFGVYLVLFFLAIWSTYKRQGVAQRRLRIVTIVQFLTILAHYTCRAVQFGRSRLLNPPSNEQRLVDVPLLFASALTTTIAAFISDSLLAWRFYKVFECQRWALYVPVVAVTINCLFGVAEDCLFLSLYHSAADYARLEPFAFKMNVAWGWVTFGINTVMTIAILTKILIVYRTSLHRNYYIVALEAITESALVTWLGLVLLEIAALAPTKGHITDGLNFGYVMDCILPIFFGISQCLITARVGFADDSNSRDKTPTMQLSSGSMQFASPSSVKDRSRYSRGSSSNMSRETVFTYPVHGTAEEVEKSGGHAV